MRWTIFKELVNLFRRRFFESEALAEGSGFDTNVYQILGFLATPGFFIALFLAPTYSALAHHLRPGYEWELRADRLFFSAYSFAVSGFATIFEWDMLFPERRDFLALTPFPLRMRQVFSAKLAALGLFLLTIALATNAFSLVLMPLLERDLPDARAAGFARLAGAEIAGTLAPALFAFLVVAGTQGVLINFLSPLVFRRVSPYIQMAGMSLMVMALLLFPIYSMTMRPLAEHHPGWLKYFPPYWFVGLRELLVPGPGEVFAALGRLAIKETAAATTIFVLVWGIGYKRHYRRLLEAEDSGHPPNHAPHSAFRWVFRRPAERAIFWFTANTLARSAKHRLFVATYLSVGLSFGFLTLITLSHGALAISPDGARAFPFLLLFFIVSGFRVAFQFPAELPANWLFRIAEANWAEEARRATRKCVFATALVPALLIFLPFETSYWGLRSGFFHLTVQAAAGALLIELFFWKFDRVPFTCSYFTGKMNLALLTAAYLYGFTSYSFRMADVEVWLEVSVTRRTGFLTATLGLLALLRLRKAARRPVQFDVGQPAIQTLDLT